MQQASHTAYSKPTTKVAVQRARTHTAQGPLVGTNCRQMHSFNTTPPLRASGNPLGIGQSRRYALEALGERAQGIQKNGEQACMQRVAVPVRSILLVVVGPR